MCHKIKTLARVKNGELSFCIACNIYHLEFNNIYFEFSKKQLKHFKEYIFTIDLIYWENKYSCTKIKRKIPIPSMQHNLILMFYRKEIEELKSLFFNQEKNYNIILSANDIDYDFILN